MRADWSIPKASSMNQIVVSRRAQSPSCHSATERNQRSGVWTIVNAWPTRSWNSATWALTQIASPMRPNTSRSSTISPTRSCSNSQRKSKLGREGSTPKPGRTPCVIAHAKSETPQTTSTMARTRLELTSVV